jgi:formate dehydrogenase (NADP+) beta subunit
VQPTDISNPDYFHKVVDCQWACPAHTPVPEYIRLIADRRYTDAYMVNWYSNIFPGILGRTCDRPCEPACRRGRVEKEPVAICRLKRVAADNKGDIRPYLPAIPRQKNGKRIALVGAGPASLTVARDLMPLGYHCVLFDGDGKGGGMMRTQIPRFRLPETITDEEVDLILDMGVETRFGEFVGSLKALLTHDWDAVFIGCGAPRGRDLDIPGRQEAVANIHIGIDWLSSVSFGHIDKIGRRVIVLGGGNTAMDCCRSSRRLGGEQVTVVVRSGFDEMKASAWEKEDAMHEGIPILNWLVPKEFTHETGRLTGVLFEKVEAQFDARGRRNLVPTGEPDEYIPCDDVLIAVGQENAFPWIERDIGIEFDRWGMPKVDPKTMQSTLPNVLFGGDAAFGPKNIIWAVAHGHDAAISIDKLCHGEDVEDRPPPGVTLVSQKMGIHEWSYDNDISNDLRYKVPLRDTAIALKNIRVEVELGYDEKLAFLEAERCLNCDVQTVFTGSLCIECDACVDICPMDCITFTDNGSEENLRSRLMAPALNLEQDLYIGDSLKTGRIMVKDEDVCLHCGLCAERCPTGAWDMRKFLLDMTQAGPACRSRQPAFAE